MRCRKVLNLDDPAEQRKVKMGDKKLETSILIGSKVMRPFEANIVPVGAATQYPSLSTRPSPDYMQVTGMQKPLGYQAQQLAGSSTAVLPALGGPPGPAFPSKNINDELRMIFDEGFIQRAREREIPVDPHPIAPMFQTPEAEPFEEQVTEEQIRFQNRLLESLSEKDVLKVIDLRYPVFWSGLMTKSLKNNVVVDAHFVSGDFSMVTEEILTNKMHNLNLTLRSTIDEVTKRIALAVMILVPSNSTQVARFNEEYRSYFKEKRIVGIVNYFKGKIVYIFPYYEEIKELVPGLRDGNYMIAMISEFNKQTEMPKKEDSGNLKTEADGSSQKATVVDVTNAVACDVESALPQTSSQRPKEQIVNDLEAEEEVRLAGCAGDMDEEVLMSSRRPEGFDAQIQVLREEEDDRDVPSNQIDLSADPMHTEAIEVNEEGDPLPDPDVEVEVEGPPSPQ